MSRDFTLVRGQLDDSYPRVITGFPAESTVFQNQLMFSARRGGRNTTRYMVELAIDRPMDIFEIFASLIKEEIAATLITWRGHE